MIPSSILVRDTPPTLVEYAIFTSSLPPLCPAGMQSVSTVKNSPFATGLGEMVGVQEPPVSRFVTEEPEVK